MTDEDERRHQPRYPIRAFATLGNSEREFAAHILDISYEGARLALLDDYHLCAGDFVYVRLEIPEMMVNKTELPYIHLQGTLVHQQEHMIGIQYEPQTPEDAERLRFLLRELH